MNEPPWVKTISNHAVIKKSELLEWLGVSSNELRLMVAQQGFPPPRFGGFQSKPTTERLTSTSRWRAGDVRAWLEGSARLKKEMETEIGAERCAKVKTLVANGHDGMGGWKKPVN